MKFTSSLYVRNLLAKLHPPVPRTPRESQQLLNLLDTSFRRQLNAEYPVLPSNNENEVDADTHPELGVGSSHATQQHMESILVHPLLQMVSSTSHGISSLTRTAVTQLDEALSGKCDHGVIMEALIKYRQGLDKKERPNLQYRLGPRIMFWLSSRSLLEKLAFVSDTKLMDKAVPVMHADGMEEMVWDWLRMLYEENGKDITTPSLVAEDMLVSFLMRESIKRKSVQDAAQQYVQACKYRVESGRAEVVSQNSSTSALQYQPLINSWKRIAVSILTRRSNHGIGSALFDNVLAYSVPFSFKPTPEKCFLSTFNPSNPSADLLYQSIQSPSFVKSFTVWLKSLTGENFKKAILIAILDAAQLFLSQKKFERASAVLEFAEARFPWIIPEVKQDLSTAGRLEHARQSVEPRISLQFAIT